MRALSAKIIRLLTLIDEEPRSGAELARIAPECFTLKQDDAGQYIPHASEVYAIMGRIKRRGLIRLDLTHKNHHAETWQARKCSKYYQLTHDGKLALDDARRVLADTSFKPHKKRGRPPRPANVIATRKRKRRWNAKRT